MKPWVGVETSNGHTVLLDLGDWETLRPLLAAGLKLQTARSRDTVVVVLREYAPPRQILLSKALFGGAEVRLRNGDPLDLRRENLECVRAAQTA